MNIKAQLIALALSILFCGNAFSVEDEDVWEKLDVCSITDLQNFTKQYPASKHSTQAALALELQKTILAIKNGVMKPQLVIPFKALGEDWKKSKELLPERGLLGLGTMNTAARGAIFYVNSPIGEREIQIRLLNGARLTSKEKAFIIPPHDPRPAFPTGHGSIVCYDTGGAQMHVTLKSCWVQIDGRRKLLAFIGQGGIGSEDELRETIKETKNEELKSFLKGLLEESYYVDCKDKLFFGVVDNVGYVYLKGNGSVTLPSGIKMQLPITDAEGNPAKSQK